MTKISQYSTDVNITGNDKWIGSDAQNFLITKNFTPNNLASFFNENNVIDIGASIRYRYQTLDPGEAREQGTISFETEIGPQVNFSAITTFLIAKNTLKGNTVTQYLDFLVDGKVLLSKASNINIFGYYKITSIEPWIPNTDFFVVEVDFLTGNGFIYEDLDYLVSLVDKVQEVPPPVWGSITGDIEDQTDLIDYISSQIITPTLAEVLAEGNTTGGENIVINDADAIQLENASTLKKGTYDFGADGGISRICGVGFEDMWQSGIRHVFDSNGLIRNSTNCFDIIPDETFDDTLRFKDGSLWTLDNGTTYICIDATTGDAVWELANQITLQQVLDNNHNLINGNNFQGTTAGLGATGFNINAFGTNAALNNNGSSLNALGNTSGNNNSGDNVNAFGDSAGNGNTFSHVNLLGQSASADENGQTVLSKDGTIMARISTTDLTATRKYNLPDASGTLALTSDIPTTSGIPHATAAGTDTYTATVTGVTAYNDADAYLIRFTNGNTTGATLNINGLGAIPLYRNNDGPLLGGDILAGGEMLCIYNSTLVEFQVIGISPNSLIAYVTNDDSVTITKGMPVYAFSGTGDRMTVKRAFNTSDATSAQTVGLVLSTSIGVNQKGVIMMQGLLDGLSILPTATWDDGDPVYLGATAGTITNVKPYAPNHLVYLGVVTTASNGAAGRMYVRVQNGFELDELHNVDAHNPNNNDGIFYNSTTQLWEHKNVLAVAAERRNANNSSNNSINYCGIAPADSLESASVWTITRLTITLAGAVTTANAINVKWTDRETTIYT